MIKKRTLIFSVGLFLLYNMATGGGLVIVKTDSLATLGIVAEANLTDGARVYLKETPTRSRFYVPFVFYYVRETYPFHLRFYASTRDGNIGVSDNEWPSRDTNVVVTEVHYHRKPDDTQTANAPPVFKVSSWKEIVIPEAGEWIVESKGYVRHHNGETQTLIFPTMTIRPTLSGRTRFSGFAYYAFSELVDR